MSGSERRALQISRLQEKNRKEEDEARALSDQIRAEEQRRLKDAEWRNKMRRGINHPGKPEEHSQPRVPGKPEEDEADYRMRSPADEKDWAYGRLLVEEGEQCPRCGMWNTYSARHNCVCRDYELRESPPSIGIRRPSSKEYAELQYQLAVMRGHLRTLRSEGMRSTREYVHAASRASRAVEEKSQKITRMEHERAEREARYEAEQRASQSTNRKRPRTEGIAGPVPPAGMVTVAEAMEWEANERRMWQHRLQMMQEHQRNEIEDLLHSNERQLAKAVRELAEQRSRANAIRQRAMAVRRADLRSLDNPFSTAMIDALCREVSMAIAKLEKAGCQCSLAEAFQGVIQEGIIEAEEVEYELEHPVTLIATLAAQAAAGSEGEYDAAYTPQVMEWLVLAPHPKK